MDRSRLAYPVIVVALIGVVWYNNQQGIAHQAREGKVAHDALCSFKDNIVTLQVTARQFLKDNPDGIPGITAADIQLSIKNRQKTIDSLGGLKC